MIELTRGENQIGILPGLGASLSYWRLRGRDLLVPTADPNLRAQQDTPVAAYPLMPYSNRIADARFSFEGQDYELAKNIVGESGSIHGNAWERAWTVIQQDPDRAILLYDHDPSVGENAKEWPFAYRGVISFVLLDNGLNVELLIANRDTRAQPVGMGFHPFFVKAANSGLTFQAQGVWENDAATLPVRHAAVEGEWDFVSGQKLTERRIDNCFSGWADRAVISYPDDGYEMHIDADPVFQHLVVFTAPEKPFVAVEAVTNMNDAIHHPEVLERGLHVLKPDQRLSGVIRYKVVERRG
ncbi:aldose 1-epimerase [Kozakia baliensis]|uniref:aldose 1-epimerase n=1 Tax=Kozakia baliensis TaxID=153496 RepID=UPI00087D23E2|nr:aldose 1-epimerase [Kozakia baliensis]AOX19315.1 hypothetical protein A0U90_02300 [Kozakia baliensis]